jgi:hypothetical protein
MYFVEIALAGLQKDARRRLGFAHTGCFQLLVFEHKKQWSKACTEREAGALAQPNQEAKFFFAKRMPSVKKGTGEKLARRTRIEPP